jgi:RNA polymerase sigma-70 factor (ECF subfamily)
LPAVQQEAIIMRYVNDLEVSEIALALDRTEGAVRALISRGLRGLRAKLACEGGAT